MTISVIVRPLAIAATMLAMATVHAVAEGASIFQATLAEANQKTDEVSTEQLRQILTDDSGTVVDTRTRLEFEAGHIPGARNLDGSPSEHVAVVERLMHSDKGKALVLYCNGPYCQASRRLADQLVAAGFTNVRRYQLGIPIWRALGGPTAIELGGIEVLRFGTSVRVEDLPRTKITYVGRETDAAWRKAARFDATRGRLSTWLMTIAHNLAVDRLRRETGVTRPTLVLVDEVPERAGVDEGAVVLERDAAVRALESLSDAERRLLARAYFRGLTAREIAEADGIPLGTVKTRLRAALIKVRRANEGKEPS
jgi:RNA polymerase sigma factor (sigma-70 family)